MISSACKFLGREFVIVLLTLLTIVPAFMAGVVTDISSIHLFALSEDSLPRLSLEVAQVVGGFHGFPQALSLGCWLLTIIFFQLLAFNSRTSLEFRVRFLSVYVLTWILFAGFVLTVWAAALLPHGILLSRMDSWLPGAANLMVLAALIVALTLPIGMAVLGSSRRNQNH